ncbi:hydrogenase/urease nickel incorporation protein HypA [Helicobacter monodelphidis]|uniref:hydrogenase/urease nickel incorporation protein HypA n=1 Tax=Helicobacter sp. 15-1451 TaxID=2004995 RepID=UPI000DCC3BB2|nr:hydrogenase/urease nickel incorporation protein HypA [Helicobacter sp. 15-1451]RAX58946.1 hydrogenase/urease nickel incorporation protein HypA [Helicobacter sp. 15-1451]
MHEYSIVASLMELCEEQVFIHQADFVSNVVVGLGERCGVNPHLFESAFENYKVGSVCEKSGLEIRNIRVKLSCICCRQESYPHGLEYGVCGFCGSREVKIIEGQDMLLLSVELQKEES